MEPAAADVDEPLASRMRPRSLEDIAGQQDLTRPDSWFASMINEGRSCSCIFWGPPGVGKTTLATLMADAAVLPFAHLSAVSAGKAEIHAIVKQARDEGRTGLLFLDEIHRFNKAQQDVLLPYIEDGTLVLVGATTENPSFSLNNALLSRCHVVVLKALDTTDITSILIRACRYLQQLSATFDIESDVLKELAASADGDARYGLNALESLFNTDAKRCWAKNDALAQSFRRAARYDRDGDSHYDLISALHKCIRDSDVDAALYWLARMLEAGEQPLYIARRLIRMATEDIGLADPKALNVVLDAHRMYEIIGSPEGELAIAELVIYLACAPKSNAAYTAFDKALEDAKEKGSLPVPLHIRNAPTSLLKAPAYGQGYKSPH